MIFDHMEFHNIDELVKTDGAQGLRVQRIPETVRMKMSGIGQNLSLFPCGTEIRFNMLEDSVKIKLIWGDEKFPMDNGMAQIFFGPFQAGSRFFKRGEVTGITITKPEKFDQMAGYAKGAKLPFDINLVRIILPYEGISYYVGVEGKVQPPERWQTPGKRYLAYGSSITQGSSTSAYAAKTAQYLGADLVSLGFAGSAKLENELADYIAARDDWDFATIEMGINMLQDFSIEEFAGRVDYFISKIVEKHADKWIFCIDIFTHEGDLNGDEKTVRFREIVKAAVAKAGLPKLVHISGTSILRSLNGLSIDGVHPGAFGVDEMALNLSDEMKKYLCR